MQRNLVGLGVLVALAVVCGFGGWWLFRGSSSATVPSGDVAVVNGEPITRERWATEVALHERAIAADTGASAADLNQFIDTTLVEQAAARAGVTCTDAEAQSERDQQRSTFTTEVARDSTFALSVLLPKVVIDGDVAEDYLQTPEPLRTPSGPDAVATYWASPRLLSAYKQDCVMDKVRRVFEDKQPPGVWMKSLRDKARIIIAPDAVPTATSVPTQLPPPKLGCGADFPCPR